jgi:hypothetical protein
MPLPQPFVASKSRFVSPENGLYTLGLYIERMCIEKRKAECRNWGREKANGRKCIVATSALRPFEEAIHVL